MTWKIILLVVALTLVDVAVGDYKSRWLPQRVNHFDPSDHRQWNMRYYSNDAHYQPGGPIFIYIGAGYEVYGSYLDSGLVYDVVREVQGYLFATESRFYGESRPMANLTTESLQYMTMEQTVADLVYFIAFIRDLYNVVPTTRVILFGKEIGASIAAWTRQQHPYLVNGVLASSAPMQSQVDNSEFLVNVGHTIRDFGSDRCYERIQNAYTSMAQSIVDDDVERLQRQFRTCTELNTTSELDVASFKVAVTMIIAVYVSQSTPALMTSMCDSITDEAREDDVDALAHWMMEELLDALPCFEYSFDNIIREYSVVEWDTTASAYGGRQAYYLQCTQIPNYPTTSSDDQPFGDFLDLDLFAQSCMILFGNQFNGDFIENAVVRKNVVFGGVRPNVRNIFFTNGEMDPLRTLGVAEDLNEEAPATLIPGTSRARDLGSINPAVDSEEMTAVKRRSRDLIIEWLLEI